MRIVYVATGPVPSRAAHGVQIVQMCAAFADLGHEVTLITPCPGRSDRDIDVSGFYGVDAPLAFAPLPDTGRFPGGGYLYALRAVRHAKKLRPDLVYNRNLKAAVFAARQGLDTVLEMHRPDQLDHRDQAALFRRLLDSSRLRRLVVISRALAEEITRRFPAAAPHLTVAHDAAADLAPDTTPVELAPSAALLEVGYVGSLNPGKGLDLIRQLAARAPWARFHVVGGTEAQVAALREDPSLPSNLVIHGFVPPAATGGWLLACDVLLAPYQHHVEGSAGTVNLARWMSPLKLFEYMAAARPVVVSDLPVLHEIIEHDRDAILCPPDDVPSWLGALERLRDDPALRARLGSSARHRFVANHTYRARARHVLDAP